MTKRKDDGLRQYKIVVQYDRMALTYHGRYTSIDDVIRKYTRHDSRIVEIKELKVKHGTQH